MKSSLRRLAKSISERPLNLQETSATLLPPIPLYRAILRVHRRMPTPQRSLGDDYVKAEFRRHRDTSNPLHIIGFLSEWKRYLDEMRSTSGDFRGRPLDQTVLESMSSEQIGQLYELMHAAKDVWKTPEELARSPEDDILQAQKKD